MAGHWSYMSYYCNVSLKTKVPSSRDICIVERKEEERKKKEASEYTLILAFDILVHTKPPPHNTEYLIIGTGRVTSQQKVDLITLTV